MLAAPPAKKYANAKFLLHAVLILWVFDRSGRQRKLHLLVRPLPDRVGFSLLTKVYGSGRVPHVRTSVHGPKMRAKPFKRSCRSFTHEGRVHHISLVFREMCSTHGEGMRNRAPDVRRSQTDAICRFSAESFSLRSTRSAMSATSSATLATAALPRERYR